MMGVELNNIETSVSSSIPLPGTIEVSEHLNGIIDDAGIEDDKRLDFLKQFKEILGNFVKNDVNKIDELKGTDGETILQKLCDEELPEFVEVLLNYGVNTDQITAKNSIPPILIATLRGNGEILKMLIEKQTNISNCIKSGTNETIMHLLLKKNTDDSEQVIGLEACLNVLFGNTKFQKETIKEWLHSQMSEIVNKRDKYGNTALYYATQKWPGTIVFSLLKLGAKIGMKKDNESLVSWIPTTTFEDFLDECCLKSNYSIGDDDRQIDLTNPKLEIAFDYSFLVPSYEDFEQGSTHNSSSSNSSTDYTCCLSCGDGEDGSEKHALRGSNQQDQASISPLPETEPLWHLAQSKSHSKLLKHPVLTSFLWLKWIRIRRYYNRKIRFCALFTFVLTWYILYGLGEEVTFQYSNLFKIFCSMFLITMTVWIMNDTIDIFRTNRMENKRREDPTTGAMRSVSANAFKRNFAEMCFNVIETLILILFLVILLMLGGKSVYYGLVALVIIMIFMELFQAMVSVTTYTLSFTFGKNLVEIFIIGSVILLLSSSNFELKRHVAAFTIVLSWGKLITLVGKHPRSNRMNMYVTMLYKVTKSFFFFLVVYIFFIWSFSLGFYVLLNKDYLKSADNSEMSTSKEDYKFFNSTWQSFIKASTMFSGELEFGDIPFDNTSSFAPLGYVFFLSFLFFIVVVLMNLLTGLAVTDISLVQEKAEIMGYKSKIDLICKAEAIILDDPYNFLSRGISFQWMNILPKWRICVQLRECFYKIIDATQILLFYDKFLPENQFKVHPNKVGCVGGFKGTEFMENVIKPAKHIILNSSNKKLSTNLDTMWNKMKEMDAKMDQLIQRLQ